MGLPRLIEIRRHFPDRSLPDVYRAVRQEMDSAAWVSAVPSGSRIAVGVGSRGIANIDTIVRAVVDSWLGRGVKPFIIPVMGSHGGGTAQGQREVLAHYGITEQSMGAPVVSSLDVVQVGETPQGIAVSMDKEAWEADGVMLCSRVKWHTGFDGRIESGVHKMMAIGLGKWEGARRYHMWAVRLGLEQVIREVGKVMLATGRMLGGLAILEDANHSSAEVHALGAANMLSREEQLLARVKRWKADIPFEAFDLLIVDEIGKNISGSGMDTKVINRSSLGRNCWPGLPRIERIYARSLTPHGGGNAVGIGLCDIVHDRLFDAVDFGKTWINSFTASSTVACMCPPHFPTDRECLERILATCGRADMSECSVVWIRNTMELAQMRVSENLFDRLRKDPTVEAIGEAGPISFDLTGQIVDDMQIDAAA
jgi:hypothetical protein